MEKNSGKKDGNENRELLLKLKKEYLDMKRKERKNKA